MCAVQISIHLQRLEEHYYLNPALVEMPPLSAHDSEFHVYLQSYVHTVKNIDPVNSETYVKLHTSAYWIDARLPSVLSTARPLKSDYVWYPRLDVANKIDMESTLDRLVLLSTYNLPWCTHTSVALTHTLAAWQMQKLAFAVGILQYLV